MSGFGKVVFEGEFFNQKVVNVFHFRSTQWLPGQGNPFDDVLAFVDAVVAAYKTDFLSCMNSNYTLNKVVGTGYDDSYGIVTASPLIRDILETGTLGAADTSGAAQTAIISLRCGEQVQINGTGTSKRNRGYLAIGPIGETYIDDYSHLVGGMVDALDTLAAHLDDGLTVLVPAVTLTPIRLHEKWVTVLGIKTLAWRTYSDIKGYAIDRVASYRRSRRPEA